MSFSFAIAKGNNANMILFWGTIRVNTNYNVFDGTSCSLMHDFKFKIYRIFRRLDTLLEVSVTRTKDFNESIYT
mgnify:CR=1 FL=1